MKTQIKNAPAPEKFHIAARYEHWSCKFLKVTSRLFLGQSESWLYPAPKMAADSINSLLSALFKLNLNNWYAGFKPLRTANACGYAAVYLSWGSSSLWSCPIRAVTAFGQRLDNCYYLLSWACTLAYKSPFPLRLDSFWNGGLSGLVDRKCDTQPGDITAILPQRSDWATAIMLHYCVASSSCSSINALINASMRYAVLGCSF